MAPPTFPFSLHIMKPYIVKCLELAVACHRRNPDSTSTEALEHLAEAARQVRADTIDAATAKEKIQAEHDKQALVRIVTLLAPDGQVEQWGNAAHPDGASCADMFGPPEPDAQRLLARALGLHTKEELDDMRHSTEHYRAQVVVLEEKLRAEREKNSAPLVKMMGDTVPFDTDGTDDMETVLDRAKEAVARSQQSAQYQHDAQFAREHGVSHAQAAAMGRDPTLRPKAAPTAKPGKGKTNGEVWKAQGVHPGEQSGGTTLAQDIADGWLPEGV